MRIYIVSDIHLDFDINRFVNLPKYQKSEYSDVTDLIWFPKAHLDDVLVIAGDIWNHRKFLTRKFPNGQSWFQMVADMYRAVVFVLGNHDYWGTNINLEHLKIRDEIKKQNLQSKLFFLDKDTTVVIDDVKFVGATLWTDFDRSNPLCMLKARQVMKDYHQITIRNYSTIRDVDINAIHAQQRSFIFNSTFRDHQDQKIVVVTHHAPHKNSIAEHYWQNPKTAIENYFYFSDLEREIAYSKDFINLWIHGHTHDASDYVIESSGTRVICNPRGYGDFDLGFKEDFYIDL